MMKHGSLFSGIGGFDLASSWMGWDNVFHCEINEFCNKILKYYWPEAIQYENIKNTDFTIHRGSIDILTGGFPCQPYSMAGDRKGKEDERHLWPEMLRAIGEIQPRWIVGENVRGLVSWNGGMVFEEVCSDLENAGYEVMPFLIPAAGIGAPHQRMRIWFVAYAQGKGTWQQSQENRRGENGRSDNASEARNASDSGNEGLQGCEFNGAYEERKWQCEKSFRSTSKFHKISDWKHFPTESPICGGDDGVSERLDGITFPKWRNESIKGYGNAIVPQVAYEIFKSIMAYDERRINDPIRE